MDKVFNYENCTVVVHMGDNSQKVVEQATEIFLKRLLEREVLNEC